MILTRTNAQVAIILIFVVLAAGCAAPQKTTEITIPGHGNQVYTLVDDVNKVLDVPIDDPARIKLMFDSSDVAGVVFNGSDSQQNAYYQTVLTNMAKMPVFYSYEGKLLRFEHAYFIGGTWYNQNDEEINEPNFSQIGAPVMWLRPTGEDETAIRLDQGTNIIYVKGKDLEGLRLAGDRLSLAVMGINEV